jgi:DNA-binding MarR family transcriptional regulator
MNSDVDYLAIHDRRNLRAFYEAIKRMRLLSATMPMAELQMFLLVALNEGLSLGELAEAADMKKSTASRYLLDLSDKTRTGDAGYALITRDSDPKELRRNMYALTPKGRSLLKDMISSKD